MSKKPFLKHLYKAKSDFYSYTNEDVDFNGAELINGTLVGFELKDISETSTAPSSGTNILVLDLELGNVFETTLTEDVTTLTINNPPVTGKAGSLTLKIIQGAGAYGITWGAKVKWALVSCRRYIEL